MKTALVLSGGGSRGAYQIGVWKALKKLNKKIDIVTGTSIGALNGCLIVQNDYNKAIKMWENLSFTDVFDKEINFDFTTNKGKKNLFALYAKAALTKGGMDISNLENTVKKAIDLNKFYKSKIDYGLLTVKVSKFEPIYLQKKDIEQKKLADYLIASATCFPAFKKKKIENDTYIDGGYYDNLPINLAIELKADEVIAVDLNAIGITQKVDNEKIKITYIRPRNSIGNFLIFDSRIAKKAIRYGYNDTMKIFKKLDGNTYTFKKHHLDINMWLHANKLKHNIENFLSDKAIVSHSLKKNIFTELIVPKSDEHLKEIILNNLEYLGKIFNIDDSRIHGIFSYNYRLSNALRKVPAINRETIEESIKKGNLKALLNQQNLIKYLFDKLSLQENIKVRKELINLSIIFPKEFLGALYLYTIEKHYQK